ncbi:hypothetical protein GCM10007962_29610 [Yeosuana aromativorans]|uniref:Uncharacterized protein n=1 Tax=Yeosuana aromativorans TaxID=288019 RepID=A0A8J3BP85_9FLAO|nr:hypothetical protein [Yeosuana aromativorans]GGK33327.1 hypothetical protein GCM10007962_29610 [Yeosuana aromativorans]
MKTYFTTYKPIKHVAFFIVILMISTVFQSCKSDKKKKTTEDAETKKEQVIDVLTENMEFQMPDTIPSGWVTFRYKNASPQTHFMLIDDYPDGKTLDTIKARVLPPFDAGMKLITEGNPEEGFAEFGNLPKWFNDVKFVGGTGLISPNHVAVTTMKIKPGYYPVECYVKMSNGVFHGSMGMVKELIVSDTDSGNKEPKADIAITISSTDGIVFNDSIQSGAHTFSVFYKDQIVHENFVGHDVNLAKLDDTANLDDLNNWMDWSNPKGLIDPAPQGVTFLGGVNNMLAGDTGYFTATLTPGKYVLISEVPNPASKNMMKTFVVSE